MNDQKTPNQFPTPDSQLKSGIAAVLLEPLDQDAINRVKARAKALTLNSETLNSEIVGLGLPSKQDSPLTTSTEISPAVSPSATDRESKSTRSRFKYLFWVNAIAASLAVVFGASMLFAGNKSAFADAIERLRAAGTVSFVMEFTLLPDEVNLGSRKANVMVAADGRCRMDWGDVILLSDASGQPKLMIEQSTEEATVFDVNKPLAIDFNYPDWFAELKALQGEPAKELGKRSIDGVETEGFVVILSGEEMTIWVDSKSKELVQITLDASEGSVTVKGILCDFEYDKPMDESLFNFDVPTGYTEVKESDLDEFENPPDESVVEGLRIFTSGSNGKFPDDLEELRLALTTVTGMESMFAIEMLVRTSKKEEFGYLGAGKSVGDERSIVFWLGNEDVELFAVYSDLTTAKISEDQIPRE